MKLDEFRIGELFRCGGQRWRCTDIGTRTIAAICLDRVEVESPFSELKRTLGQAEAEAEGWFSGPLYAVLQHVFDEDAIGGCLLAPDGDTPPRLSTCRDDRRRFAPLSGLDLRDPNPNRDPSQPRDRSSR